MEPRGLEMVPWCSQEKWIERSGLHGWSGYWRNEDSGTFSDMKNYFIELITDILIFTSMKTWGQALVVLFLVSKKTKTNKEQNGKLLWELGNTLNEKIEGMIEFGFHMI